MAERLTPPEIAGLLRAAAAMLAAELRGLPEALLRFHPAAGQWCAKEVLGHLIEAERRGFAGRIRIILAERDPALAAWDQEAVARERRDCERPLAVLLDEFMTMREASAALVDRLGPADLSRGGHHPLVGYLTVADLTPEWVHHDRNHLRQILANVQAYVWPSMGNAQRFSELEA
ncbi:MAG: DinB family protein [Candidatus Rokuibacteriota bacterium]